MRRDIAEQWSAWGAALALASMTAASPSAAADAPASNVTLRAGQVEVNANKSTSLQMYLPNSGALAGGKSNAVLAAAFSMEKAGTSLTLKSGYHARNNKAIRGYMASHAPGAQGGRGSLNAHWAGEADLYNDVRRSGYDAMPSLELEGLHELGVTRTLKNGFQIGLNVRSKSDKQSVTTTLGYKHGSLNYSGTMTKNMLGGVGMHGQQRLQVALGRVSLDGGMVMRTARDGSFETLPFMTAKTTLKGIGVKATYKRDPKRRLAGQAIESTMLEASKSFIGGRLQIKSDIALRSVALASDMMSSTLGISFKSAKDAGDLSWTIGASALHLAGGGGNGLTLAPFSSAEQLRSTLGTLQADMRFQLSAKTELGLKGAAKHLASDMGSFQRTTLSAFVKHGLWDFQATAGLNRARQDGQHFAASLGSLHRYFAQRSFGQFSQQRAIFSFKAKYSY